MPIAATLTTLHPMLLIFLLLVAFIGFSVIGTFVLRQKFGHEIMSRHREVAGFVFATVGVIYAVLLAFVVLVVWEEFNNAKSVAEQESACLLGITRIVNHYPVRTPQVERLCRNVRSYAKNVVEREYPAMRRIQRDSTTVNSFDSLWSAVVNLDPQGPQQENLQSTLLSFMSEVQKNRVARILASRTGIPTAIWIAIIAGAVVTMGFSLLFSTEDLLPQMLIVSSLGIVTALVIFVIIEMNYPFIGHISVHPEGFDFVLRHSR